MTIPDCVAAIAQYRQKGYEITSLDKVFVADLSYIVSFSDDTSGAIKASLLRGMGAQLGASYDARRDTLVRGNALTFGFSVPGASPVPVQ